MRLRRVAIGGLAATALTWVVSALSLAVYTRATGDDARGTIDLGSMSRAIILAGLLATITMSVLTRATSSGRRPFVWLALGALVISVALRFAYGWPIGQLAPQGLDGLSIPLRVLAAVVMVGILLVSTRAGAAVTSRDADPSWVLPWPRWLEPHRAAVYCRNAIIVRAPAERVWECLLATPTWPALYDCCAWVEVTNGSTTLREGSKFRWKATYSPDGIFGFVITSDIRVFEPPARIAWHSTFMLVGRSYHTFVVEPRGDSCRVVTEETIRGGLPGLLPRTLAAGVHRNHQNWIEGLAEGAAASGQAATVS